MKKKSYFTSGSGARKAFVSSFQDKTELKEVKNYKGKAPHETQGNILCTTGRLASHCRVKALKEGERIGIFPYT